MHSYKILYLNLKENNIIIYLKITTLDKKIALCIVTPIIIIVR